MSHERAMLRLECLRLASTRVPSHEDTLKRAEDYFDFVNRQDAKALEAQAKKPAPQKMAGNVAEIL